MKIQPDKIYVQSISGYGAGWVSIGDEKIHTSFVITSMGDRFLWPCKNFETLQPQDFEELAKFKVELIIFGSGKTIRFPKAKYLEAIITKQIGIETMDTQAACRTYNILASEGRKVLLAALI